MKPVSQVPLLWGSTNDFLIEVLKFRELIDGLEVFRSQKRVVFLDCGFCRISSGSNQSRFVTNTWTAIQFWKIWSRFAQDFLFKKLIKLTFTIATSDISVWTFSMGSSSSLSKKLTSVMCSRNFEMGSNNKLYITLRAFTHLGFLYSKYWV